MPSAAKAAAHRRVCPCCDRYYGYLVKVESRMIYVREAIDHIFPRRWILEYFPSVDPHQERNLVSICSLCHGGKKVAEDMLYQGNVFGFLTALRCAHYPMNRVFEMAKILSIKEIEGWNL